MINQDLLDKLESLGFGADIDSLEDYVATLQDAAGMGAPLVTDTQYDMYFKLLQELKPDSEILNRNWESADNDLVETDEILASHRMMSIRTIKNIDELYKFKQALGDRVVDLFASVKENGHAIRAVYRYGQLVSGSTRGRYKKGRDITRHLKSVLPTYVDDWSDIRLMEVRGELLVSYAEFENLKHILKTPLSAVTSLVRESVTDAELKHLSCVCYKLIPCDDSPWKPDTLFDQFKELHDRGFKVPQCALYKEVDLENLDETFEDILEEFSELADGGLEYAADGIVVAVNDCDTFESMGVDGNNYLGNFAIKMGRHWETNVYKSVILDVEFIPGKTYFTPKAIIEPVITATGAQVSTVPLYNVGVMNDFHLVPGSEVYFKFGGETGVTLCDAEGKQVGDK